MCWAHLDLAIFALRHKYGVIFYRKFLRKHRVVIAGFQTALVDLLLQKSAHVVVRILAVADHLHRLDTMIVNASPAV